VSPQGTYSSIGAAEPTLCFQGTYSTVTGAVSDATCTRCPAGRTTDFAGAFQLDQCLDVQINLIFAVLFTIALPVVVFVYVVCERMHKVAFSRRQNFVAIFLPLAKIAHESTDRIAESQSKRHIKCSSVGLVSAVKSTLKIFVFTTLGTALVLFVIVAFIISTLSEVVRGTV